jgi:lipopolysaccharide transport system ATP-binding protein
MSPVDVRLENAGKRYRLGVRRNSAEFWGLRNVTFDVPRGTSVGIIGRNGAGKSTLLKLLAGITAPSEGRITIQGRLAALIEVGSGFHPELTGRENVFLSGAILGMRRRELAAKLPSILEFAGVETFVDTPVKWYSSGMYVRLGFSIAAHLEPDILLVDEVLAVGDAEFQMKCLARIDEMRRRGITIIFISHDLTAVQKLCDQAILLEKGCVAAIGPPSVVIADYHRRLTTAEISRDRFHAIACEGVLKITNLMLWDVQRPEATSLKTGDPLAVSIRYSAARRLDGVVFEITYYSNDAKTVLSTARTETGVSIMPPGGVVSFECPELGFRPGSYYVQAVARLASSGDVIDWWDGGTMLYVDSGSVDGQFYMPHTWSQVHDAEAHVCVEPS